VAGAGVGEPGHRIDADRGDVAGTRQRARGAHAVPAVRVDMPFGTLRIVRLRGLSSSRVDSIARRAHAAAV
jgi:hypothetical protein